MKRILVTGFDPFGGESINPAQMLMESVRDRVFTQLLPTCYGRSMEVVSETLDETKPDILLCLGQAGGRACLTLERVGINWMGAGIADNDGIVIEGRKIEEDGIGGYLSTLPIDDLCVALKKNGIPAQVSKSAGTFICNRVLYGALRYAGLNNPAMLVGFMHIPFLPEQTVNKASTPSMDFSIMKSGLNLILDELQK